MANIYATHKPESTGDSGLYLKIKDGETVKLRIASEPAIFESESKPDEQGNTRISTRYAWVVYTKEIKVGNNPPREINQAQIFEQSATFFKQLAGFAQDDDYGDPTGYDIKVKREGEMLNTTYQITPSPKKEELSVEAGVAVSNINLIEKLKASPFYQRVAWLSDFENNGNTPKSKGPTTQEQAQIKEDNAAIQDLIGEPVNLDDIPF